MCGERPPREERLKRMGKTAILFAGQGAQYPGMGRALYESSPAARAVFDMADAIRPGTSRQCWEGSPEELAVTVNTQPCLFTVDLACGEALREAGVAAQAAAGFSLGELAALAFSGMLRREDAFRLVCRRAELMQACAEETKGAMAAVLKLPFEQVEAICASFDKAYPVNYNCPGQLVVAAAADQMEGVAEVVKTAGGKCVPLAVSGAFHSPFMARASAEMEKELARVAYQEGEIPVYANLTGKPYAGDYAALTARQIKSPVQWVGTLQNLREAGFDTFIEAGPGKTLSGLVKKTLSGVTVCRTEDPATLAETIQTIGG